VNDGRRRELYHFRDEQGLEVDFLVPGRAGAISLVECKATRTITPAMAGPMRKLADSIKGKRQGQTPIKMFLVHQSPKNPVATQVIAPGVRASAWADFVAGL